MNNIKNIFEIFLQIGKNALLNVSIFTSYFGLFGDSRIYAGILYLLFFFLVLYIVKQFTKKLVFGILLSIFLCYLFSNNISIILVWIVSIIK